MPFHKDLRTAKGMFKAAKKRRKQSEIRACKAKANLSAAEVKRLKAQITRVKKILG